MSNLSERKVESTLEEVNSNDKLVKLGFVSLPQLSWWKNKENKLVTTPIRGWFNRSLVSVFDSLMFTFNNNVEALKDNAANLTTRFKVFLVFCGALIADQIIRRL